MGGAKAGLEEAGRQVKNEVTDPTNAVATATGPAGRTLNRARKTARSAGLFKRAWRGVKRLCGFGDDAAKDTARRYTDHALDQMKDRNVGPEAVEAAIKRGRQKTGNTGN
jgi:hypothetical protein